MKTAALGLMLLSGAVQDVKSKSLRADLLLIPGILAILAVLTEKGAACLPGMLTGLLPGAFLFLLSSLSREAVGRGDALAVSLLGAALGPAETVSILMLALFGSAIFCCLLLVMGRVSKHTALPFIPFLAAAYLVTVLIL